MINKQKAMLSKVALGTLGTILANVCSTIPVFAVTQSILTKNAAGVSSQYNLNELNEDALNKLGGGLSPLYDEFKASGDVVAFLDTNGKYIDVTAVMDAALDKLDAGQVFDVNNFTATSTSVVTPVGTITERKVVGGSVTGTPVVITPVVTTTTVSAISTIAPITVENATTTAVAIALLPTTVTLNGTTTTAAITWAAPANYDAAVAADYTFEGTLTVPTGYVNTNALKATAKVTVKAALVAPAVTIDTLVTETSGSAITVSGTVTNPNGQDTTLTVNDKAVTSAAGKYSTSVTLVDGVNPITVKATNAGKSVTTSSAITLDTTAPAVTIDSLATTTTAASITVTGNTGDAKTVTVNGTIVNIAGGKYSTNVNLAIGANTITVSAKDSVGNEKTTTGTITRLIDVSSVSAITATTVTVTLPTAPTTAYTIADVAKFAVLVNGTASVPTAIAAVAADTTGKTYLLTIPTLADNKGTLTINGTAPVNVNGGTVTGSDYNFDFAKSTFIVRGENSKTVTVIFNEKVTKATAEVPGNYNIRRISGTTAAEAATGAVLAADGKTVTLTYATSIVSAQNGYSLTVTGIKDIAGNTILTTDKIFDGVGTDDTIKPAITSVIYDQANKKITVKFNKTISALDADINELGLTVKGTGTAQSTVLTEDNYTYTTVPTNSDTLVLTLTDAQNTAIAAYTATTVDIAASAVKDTNATALSNDAQTGVTVTIAAKPQISAAAYVQNTRVLTLTLIAAPTTVDITKITVNGTALTAADTYVVADKTVTITLAVAKDTAITAAAQKITLAAGAFTTAASLTNDADATGVAVTFTADTTAPKLLKAEFNNLSKYLILTFDKNVSGTAIDIINSNIKIIDAAAATKLTVDSSVVVLRPTTNLSQLIINLSADTEVDNLADTTSLDLKALKVAFAAGTVKDTRGNLVADNAAGFAVTYTDLVAPVLSITDTSALHTSSATTNVALDATHIKVNFGEKVDTTTATTVGNYVITLAANATVTFNPTAAGISPDGKSVLLTVPDTTTYAGQYLKAKINNVKDANSNVIATDTLGYIKAASGTADVTGPVLASAVFVNANTANIVGQGDQIELTFTEPAGLVLSALTNGDFKLTCPTITTATVAATFGNDATFALKAGSSTVIVVTLGSTTNLTKASVNDATGTNRLQLQVKDSGSANIKDLYGNASTQSTAVAVAQYTAKKPYVTAAVYTDASGDGLMGAGDKLTLTFNENIDPALKALIAVDNLIFSANIFTFDQSKTTVVDKVVTLTANAAGPYTIVPGTTNIRVGTGTNMPNLWGSSADGGADVLTANQVALIAKGDTVSPTLTGASFVRSNGTAGSTLVDGDKILLTFSEAFNGSALENNQVQLINNGVATNIAITELVPTQPFKNADGTSDNTKVVLTFASGVYNIVSGVTTIAVNPSTTQTTKDANGNLLAFGAAQTITASAVASSNTLSFADEVIAATTNVAKNYVSNTNKAAAIVKFSTITDLVTTDTIYYEVTDSSVPTIKVSGSKAAAAGKVQTITIDTDTVAQAAGNLSVKVWVIEANGKITQVSNASVTKDIIVPTAAITNTTPGATAGTMEVSDKVTITFVDANGIDWTTIGSGTMLTDAATETGVTGTIAANALTIPGVGVFTAATTYSAGTSTLTLTRVSATVLTITVTAVASGGVDVGNATFVPSAGKLVDKAGNAATITNIGAVAF